jgi:phage tail sheath protein FI
MPVQTTYPGVYIEERPSGARTIVGVSTSVTAFVGAAGRGPVETPVRIFSVADYVRTFGPLLDADRPMGHAVSHFFANGGGQAIVVRAIAEDATAAALTLDTGGTGPDVLVLRARGRGAWASRVAGSGLEATVDYDATSNPDDLFTLVLSYFNVDARTNQSVLAAQETHANLSMSPANPRYALEVLRGSQLVEPFEATPAPTSTVAGSSVGASAVANPTVFAATNNTLSVAVDHGPAVDVVLFPAQTAGAGTISRTPAQIVTELNDNALPNAGLNATASQAAGVITITSDTPGLNSAVTVRPAASNDCSRDLRLGLAFGGTEVSGSAGVRPADSAGVPAGFTGGSDGSAVGPDDVVPAGGSGGIFSLGTLLFPRFNLLCLPGLTSADEVELGNALAFCKRERAFLVADSPRGGFTAIPPNLGGLPALGEHGAVYYPRVEQVELQQDGTRRRLDLPACGAVAGVMARIDSARGVFKAPAGLEAGIVGISGLTAPTDDNLSGLLNPRGVNVLRTFPGAGTVIWGARTLKGDDTQASEFKYVPVRRLTDFIASSLYLGTQFAVFEPNDPDLWAQLRLAVGTFMRGLFNQGAFQQSSKRAESDSFFVLCDETTNPQSEIDLGRVNVVVGFAPLKPAEFVVITITQISALEE